MSNNQQFSEKEINPLNSLDEWEDAVLERYPEPDAIAQYGDATLSNNNSWTGRDGINSQSAFLNNKQIQDQIQNKEFNENYSDNLYGFMK